MEENELFENLTADNDQTDDVQSAPAKVRKTAADFFRPIQVSPEVVKQTLGIESDHITPKLLMAASRKVLDIARGQAQSDDRDSLEYQRVYGSAEYLPEHIQKDGGKVARNILWKATNRGNLDFLSAGALEPHVDSVFNESKLAQYIDGTNMFEALDANTKITRIGEGGVGDQRMAPDEMRQIHNSFLGFIDSLRFPESLRIGLDSFMSKNTRKGSDGKLYTRMTNARTGKEEWVDSVTLARSTVATGEYAPGEKYGDDKIVPVPRSRKGIVSYVPRNKIDYYSARSDEMLSLAANTIPYVSGIKEMRAMLGSKHFASTVPLDNPETPWVSVKDPDTGGSIESKIGAMMGLRKASKPGVVTAVRKDRIDVQYKDGTKESFELYQDYPNNQKGFINSTPLVKAGEQFAPGKVLARTNYTNDNGEVANGVNLRTAFVSWNGLNYEDAKVISDYAAKKLASTTMYKTALDLDKSIKMGKANYLGMRPGEYSKEQMDTIGDNGLVKVGTTVSKGDPLYVGVRIVPPSPGSFGKRQFEDITETWQHDHPGIVTDVVQTKKGLKVFVKASAPVVEGDKLSNFAGMKGVVAAVIPRDKMPKDENGDPIDVLESPLGIISRTNSAFSTVMLLSEVARKRKQPYYVDSFPKEDINEFALNEAKKYNVSPTRTLTDPETGRKIKNVQVGSVFVYKQKHMSEGKESARGTSGYNAEDVPSRGGYTGCLHGNTKIHTSEGMVTIRDIVRNKLTPKVLSWNAKKAQWEYNKVTDWFAYKVPSNKVFKYTLEGGIYELVATGNHQVYDNFGEKMMIKDYEPGDRIAICPTEIDKRHIIPSRPFKHSAPFVTENEYTIVYDITVENVHNYVANRILVSNSKRIGNMETAALASHSAWDVLKDAKLVRGQANQDFWRTIRTGEIPSMPGEPIVYQKFYNHLKASGVNIKRTDTGLKVFALTNKEAENLTGSRELNSTDTFDANDYTPIKGGLFGSDIFGPDGNQWGYIKLDEPLPNPVMEEPLRRILKMSQKDFEAVIAGEQELNGMTGGKAIQQALSKINLKQELTEARQEFKTASKSNKDAALKRYTDLARMDKQGTHPSDFMLTRIPVLPAKYRPVMSSGGLTMVSDSNYLYKQMVEARDDLRSVRDLPDEVQGEARAGIYRAWKELTGMIEPSSPKLKQKAVKGLMRWALGTSPKTSAVMQKLVTSTVDTVGRGVIAPDPSLKLDEIGLPKSVAFEVYKPFVTRALVNMNYTPLEAMKQVEKQTPVATDVLQKVMEKRPVIFNRAPTLHKFSLMGHKPKITAGHVIRLNPSIVGPYAADFDGNCLDYDSEIFVKISKSSLDKIGFMDYISGNRKMKEVIMKFDPSTDVRIRKDEVVYPCKIGEFPHMEDNYRIDKNGAYVYEVPEGMEVLTIDPETGENKYAKVTGFTHEHNCSVAEVSVLHRKVIASDNESLAVFDHNKGGLRKVSPLDPDLGNWYIPVLKGDPRPFGTYGDRDLGWWIGAFISDGWESGSYIGYTKIEESKRSDFIRIARRICDNFVYHTYAGKASKDKLGDSVKVHLSGKDLVDAVKGFGLYDEDRNDSERSSLHKMIPDWAIWYGSEEFLYGLLSGLLDGDGSIVKNTTLAKPRFSCRYNTSSKSLRESFEKLLYRMGIRFSTTVTPPRGWSKESYIISPSTVDMCKVLDKLTCIGAREKALLEEWSDNKTTVDKNDVVPVTDEEWGKFRSLVHYKDYHVCMATHNPGALNRSKLISLQDKYKKEIPTLFNRVMQMNTMWAKPSNIEKLEGTRDVFDLLVEDTKVFVANNGIVVFDTANIHVPVSDAAVREVYEKMLPQRNLLSVRKHSVQYPIEKEYRQGIYLASRMKSDKAERTVDSIQEAIRMYNNNEIDIDTPIEIRHK